MVAANLGQGRHRARVTKLWYACLAGLCCSAALPAVASDSSKYRDQLASKDYAEAARSLQALLRSNDVPADRRWRLVVDLAKAQRLAGNPTLALKTLSKLDEDSTRQPASRVEQASSLVTIDQGEEAMATLHALEGHGHPEVGIVASVLLAQADLDQGRFQSCVDRCQRAIRRASQADLYHNPYAWEVTAARDAAVRLLGLARDGLIETRYGPDYAYYRRGRLAEQRRKYEEAIGHYRRVAAPILEDAAACYIGRCLHAMGQSSEAVSHLRAFIDKEPEGLYRGEAKVVLGSILADAAETRQELGQAQQMLSRARAWCLRIKTATPPVTVDSVREVLKAFPIPKKRSTRDRFGNFHRQHAGPETITNRLTSRWYLDDLRGRAGLMEVFVLAEMGRSGDATALVRELMALNQANNGGLLRLGDTPMRLAEDAKDGVFLLPRNVYRLVSETQGRRLREGCFWAVAGEHDRARSRLENVLREIRGNPGFRHDRAVAELALAHVEFESSRGEAAAARLERFETEFHDSPLLPLAMLYAANLHAGQDGGYERALEQYTWIVERVRKGDLAARALMSLAIAAANEGDDETAQTACNRLLKQYPDGDFAQAARAIQSRLRGLSTADGRRPISGSSEATGKVKLFARHLVIPGGADFTVDLSRYQSGDVLDYEIRYAVRAGCALKNFWYATTLLEPQPPKTTSSPLRFYRALALVTH